MGDTFEIAAIRSRISKQAVEVLETAEDLGWKLEWASAKKQAISLRSGYDDRKLLLPMTSINANRLRSLKTQIVRHADPEKVADAADLTRLSQRNRSAGKIPLTFDIASDNDVTTQRGGQPMSPAVERALNRARLAIDEEDAAKAAAAEPIPVARPDDYVPADVTVVSETPWMVRKGGHEGGHGTMYESHSVIHRVWSDGREDYRCRFCPYESENPRGVAGHASRTKEGHPTAKVAAEMRRVNEYQPTEIKRPLSGIRRLTTELVHALDGMADWCDMSREDLARTLAEHVYAARPDREPAAPLTPEQIIHRITLMVDAGRLAEMHQQVESTAAALREKEAEAAALSAQAAELEVRVETLQDERRALRDMLTVED